MVTSQESNMVTVGRDAVKSLLWILTRSYHHVEHVEQHDVGLDDDMDIDEDDVPPPPPPGRLTDLVVATSTPQSALQLSSAWDTQGKRHTLILARHVKDDVKRKIWTNTFVDLSDLLDKDKDDQPLHVTQSNTSLLTFKNTIINKVDGWAMWNKAFCIFIEIYFPSKCINLVQYMGILNNLAIKFPFVQVYNNNKDFRQQIEQQPDLPWHKIDQELWSTTLHGIYTIKQSQQQPQRQSGR